jgi:GNAT superfamily N-acetyltransferase
MFIDLAFAKRLENAIALSGKECAAAAHQLHPTLTVADEAIAGGIAVFAGIDSPLTQAIGMGLEGAVSSTEWDRLEAFFLDRGAPVALELSPFVHESLLAMLSARPYRVEEFTMVLIREIRQGEDFKDVAGVSVRMVSAAESRLLTEVVARGYSENELVPESLLDITEGFVHMPDSCGFLAVIDGEPAGGGSVAIHGTLGSLFGASTLPSFRKRGVQKALLAARMNWLVDHGCQLATGLTHPGSVSQRNFERAGFRPIFTRTKVARR